MILTDDNFATIVHAIEEGRVIFSNLRRVVYFLVATNIGEILTMIVALLIGMDLPLTAVMVLWINLVTDGACTIPLGVEPKHWDVLKQPPRDPRESLLTGYLIRRMALDTADGGRDAADVPLGTLRRGRAGLCPHGGVYDAGGLSVVPSLQCQKPLPVHFFHRHIQ